MSDQPSFAPLEEFERWRRDLPHWEGPGESYFITFRLHKSAGLDLTEPRFGRLVVSALRFNHDKRYLLFDYTVMPDHVHFIVKPLVAEGKTERLSRLLHSLKSYLANQINGVAGRTGALWQNERFDHILRDDRDYREKAAYILDNPRRKELVKDPIDWPWWGVCSKW